MARNKYVRDYRLVENIDERGRVRTETEYIGDSYFFVRPTDAAREKKIALALCAAGWIAFVLALTPNSAAMRTVYVALPFAFTALPLGMLTELAISTALAREPLEHYQADKLENSYPPRAMATALLPGIALIGQAVRWILGPGGMGWGDVVFTVCAAVVVCCGALAFTRRKGLDVRKG